MVARVARNIRVTVLSLDEDELIRLLDDVVFVFEQNDVAVRRDDVGELVCCTKRARRIAVDDVLGFLSADVRIEMGKIDVHKMLLSSIHTLLYYISSASIRKIFYRKHAIHKRIHAIMKNIAMRIRSSYEN